LRRDRTKREAGKIRERADAGERRNATAFLESRKRNKEGNLIVALSLKTNFQYP